MLIQLRENIEVWVECLMDLFRLMESREWELEEIVGGEEKGGMEKEEGEKGGLLGEII